MRITRKKLLEWAAEHRREADRLRARAEKMIWDADALIRKAELCERDAADEECA